MVVERPCCHKGVFVVIKEHELHSSITKLKTKDGASIATLEELRDCCKRFFSKLYKRQPNDSNMDEIRRLSLRNLTNRIHVIKKKMLANPMNEKELHITLEILAKDKAFNPNGVVFEFFLSLWDIIGRKYT